MACTITHRGTLYTPAEFAKLLKDPIFAEEVRVAIVTDKYLELAAEKEGILDATEIAKELTKKGLFGKNQTSEMAKIRLEIARRHINGERVQGITPRVRTGAAGIWSQLGDSIPKKLTKIIATKSVNIAEYVNLKLGQGVIKGLSNKIYEASILKSGRIKEQLRLADLNAAKLNAAVKKYSKLLNANDKLAIGEVLKGNPISILKLKGVTDKKQRDIIRAEFGGIISDLRNHIDDTTRKLIASGFISDSGLDIYQNNLGQYVTRIYEVHIHPRKWWDKLTKDPDLSQVLHVGKTFVKTGLEERQIRAAKLIKDVRDRITEVNKLPDSKDKDIILAQLQKRYDGLSTLNLQLKTILSDDSLLIDYIEENIGATGEDADVVKAERSELRTDQSIFKRRGNIPEEIRNLKGEVKDADAMYAATIKKMVEFDAKYNFQMTFALMGQGVLFSTERDTANGFTEEMSVANLPGIRDIVRTKGSVIYVSPEIVDEFAGAMRTTNRYVSAVKTLNGIAKWGATVGNFITQMRNFSSAFTFMLFNGNLLNPSFLKSIAVIVKEIKSQTVEGFTGRDTRSPLLSSVFDSAVRNGVVNNAIDIEEISDLFKNSWWDKVNRKLEILHRKASIPTKAVSSFIDLLNAVYAGSDNVIKIASYLAELDRYAATIGDYKSYEDIKKKADGGDIIAQSDLQRLEYKAARVVRMTVPNYSESWKVNKVIRDNVPLVGTFTTFTTEMIRTQYNGIQMLQEEYKASTDQTISNSQRGAHKKILFYRMLGFAATYAATHGQEYIREGLAALSGDDDDEDKREYTEADERDVFVKYYAPPWVRQIDLRRDTSEDSGFIYSDPSSFNPYSMLNNLALWDRTKSESTVGKLAELIFPILAPFFSKEMGVSMIKRYLDNEDDLGQPISEFNLSDNSNEFLKDFWRNEKVRMEILPGMVKEFTMYNKKNSAVEALQDKFEGGSQEQKLQWSREIKQHQENMANSLKAYVTLGYKENYVNIHIAAQYPAGDFADKVSGHKVTYSGRVKDDPKNFREIYSGLNELYKKDLNKMRDMVRETKDILGVDVTPTISKIFGIRQIPNVVRDYIFGVSNTAPDLSIADYDMRLSVSGDEPNSNSTGTTSRSGSGGNSTGTKKR